MSDTDLSDRIEAFLAQEPIGVVGASRDPAKYGHRVLAALLASGRNAIPVHPKEPSVLDVAAVPTVLDLPAGTRSISVITPPAVSETVVEAAVAHGIEHVWFQPGAESETAIATAEGAGLSVIAGGPCILVALAEERGRR